ncbi:MAG: ammonium transporter [Planctomycetota bacterium]
MNSGDTAWTLASIALVLLMTPGLAFFYAGLVRETSVVNTLKMSFIAMGLIAVEWALVGYSLAFSEGSAWIGGLEYIGLRGVGGEPAAALADNIPHLAFMAFQMMFAIITPALISGAVVGRMRFKAYVLFILGWSLVVYNPIAHWVWGPGGWIGELGALDFAGGTVVHISAGVSALVAAWTLGPTTPDGAAMGPKDEAPHNVPLVVLGTSLLWFGWFGFNAGSALAADGLAANAVVTTMLSAAAAILTWTSIDLACGRKPGAVGACVAAVVGLVAITPAAGFVEALESMAIGAIAAGTSYLAVSALRYTKLDDTLDVFACHGLGGIVGALLTGVFASAAVNPAGRDGLLAGDPGLLWAQGVSVLVTAAWAAVGTAGLLHVIGHCTSLRTDASASDRGIDQIEHAEDAYVLEPSLDVFVQRRLSQLLDRSRS